jgi:6-phosphogluconolactonase
MFVFLKVFVLTTVLMAITMGQDIDARIPQRVIIGDNHQTISCYTVDAMSGALTLRSSCPGGSVPSFVTWNHQLSILYAVNENYMKGEVRAFRIQSGTDAMSLISTASSGGKGPCHIQMHPSGKWLLVSNFGSGQVAVLPIHQDGTIGEPVDVQHPGEHSHMSLCDPSGKHVFVPCLGSDVIAQYQFDVSSGKLIPDAIPTIHTIKGAGPRFLSMNGNSIYCVNELNSTLQWYDFDPLAGTISARGDALSLLPLNFQGKNTGGHVVVSHSGKFIYASNRGHDSVAIFKRNPTDGAISYLSDETGNGAIRTPRCFTLSENDDFLLVANQGAASVTAFSVDPLIGTMRFLSTTSVGPDPAFIAILNAQ